MSKNFLLLLLAVIFVAHGILQVYLTWNENQSIDEGVHITAGYSYLVTGDFRINPEHPALSKLLAATPLLFINPNIPLEHESWLEADQWNFARQFLYYSGNDADLILRLARLPMIMLSIVLGLFIARWAFELGSWRASIAASCLYAFSPLFLTHGHFVTTDVPVTLGIFASVYFLYKYIIVRSNKWLFLIGVASAFAATTKFTGLIVFIIIPLSYVIAMLIRERSEQKQILWRPLWRIIASMLLATIFFVLTTTFFTTRSFIGDPYHGQKQIEMVKEEKLEAKGGIQTSLADFKAYALEHITLPGYPYVVGFLEFSGHYQGGHDTFFKGTFSKEGSSWYFPVTFLIKTRLGVLVLLSLLLTLFVKQSIDSIRQTPNGKWKALAKQFSWTGMLLFIPPMIYLAASMISNVNIGIRHLLPVYPFILLAAGRLFAINGFQARRIRIVLYCLLAITTASGFISFPYTMAYYSEIIGGSTQGYLYVRDSNLDWGQNLKYLKKYLDERGIDQICYSYFGQGNFEHEGIDGAYLPSTEEIYLQENLSCVVVISAESLFQQSERYRWLLKYQPNDIIAYALYVFDLRK